MKSKRQATVNVPKWPIGSAGQEPALVNSVWKSRVPKVLQQKHPQHESEVADAVDDEGFFARVRGRLFQEPKTNEQITGKADTLPADEQQNVVRRQHQNQHEEHEQIQIREKAGVASLMRHGADR